MSSRALGFVVFLFLLQLVSAQFQFFDNMFGQQRQQQQQHPGASWAAHLESVACSDYLCPATLDCVGSPVDCPCPDAEDIKCIIPDSEEKDGTVVCVRGNNECRQVEELMRRIK
ncbi:Long chronological lifespan protein 2 [Mycena sanguinolenta]|uniref:Long chronological lifespan protein 2 n=1 Tax=Mycena sanguinolenta TaxID=230812 RepID=A0A8H6Y743_9AGAR|nr:Long chronological lifespan protein 2 [Mycena sanguinolenta]